MKLRVADYPVNKNLFSPSGRFLKNLIPSLHTPSALNRHLLSVRPNSQPPLRQVLLGHTMLASSSIRGNLSLIQPKIELGTKTHRNMSRQEIISKAIFPHSYWRLFCFVYNFRMECPTKTHTSLFAYLVFSVLPHFQAPHWLHFTEI